MRIGTAETKTTIAGLAVSIVLDIVIAGLLAWFFGGEGSWLLATAVIWAIMQAASILLILLGVIRLLVIQQLGLFDGAREALLTALEEGDLPQPQSYEHSVDAYLSRVVDDEGAGMKQRLAAAAIYGGRTGIRGFAGWLRFMMIDRQHEEALKEYSRR